MAPPSFSDIGKQTKDVFGKGYHFGLVKLEVKSKTSTGVEFTAGGSSSTDGGAVAGNIETKYKCSDYGMTFTEKWSTDNTLNATIDVQDKVMPGLKLTLDGNFKPDTGAMAGKLKTDYKHDALAASADMNLASKPAINVSASVGHGAFALGYNTCFDTAKSALTKHNVALGYSTKEMVAHVTANDKKVFGAGIYHKISADLETGVNISAAMDGKTGFGVGCKYTLGPDASIRAKVDNSSLVGLSYQQKLRDGITLTLSTQLDGTKLNQPGHKLGVALEMSA
eukprot:TRINITY_DN5870_c0_g1_i1.p1 TRINITY_DN5870_c0_g1~~TRINITY_DN5870_c0_g1_i1.p1  ORF type:complete len:281 (-),score=104.40 TRINITY_DN5870_c0_g1_i1:1175-2017(-)